MKKLKQHPGIVTLFATVLILMVVWIYPMHAVQVSLRFDDCDSFVDGERMKFYFDIGNGILEENSADEAFTGGDCSVKLSPDYDNASAVRIDIEGLKGERTLSDIGVYSGAFTEDDYRVGTIGAKYLAEASEVHDIEKVTLEGDHISFEVVGDDPYFILSADGVKQFRRCLDNFWYFKLAVSVFVLAIGLLRWVWVTFPAGEEKGQRARRIALLLIVSSVFQIFFIWHVIRSVEPVPVLDTTEGVTYSRAEGEDTFTVTGLKNGLQTLELQVAEIDAENPLAASVNSIKITVLSGDGSKVLGEETVEKTQLSDPNTVQMKLDTRYEENACQIEMTDAAGEDVGIIGISLQTSGRQVNTRFWLIVYCLVCNLVLAFVVLYQDIKNAKQVVLPGIYIVSFLMCCFKMWVYRTYIHGFADESYHIAYVAYLEKTGKIIPNFSDMRALSISGSSAHFASLPRYNYLGHPPLYYHFLRLANAVKFDGDTITLNLMGMRMVSNVLALIGIAVVMYIGFSRIRKDRPYWHLFYLTSVLCIPMMIYDVSGINNDVLPLLGCGLFFLGALRFTEEKRSYLTFFLMAFGICFSLLGKLTAGCVLVLTTVFFAVCFCVREKSIKKIWCKPFWATLPVYGVTLFYFAVIYLQTGKLQPRIKDMANGGEYKPKFYVEFMDRQDWSVLQYITRFIDKFCGQWLGISSHVSLPNMGSNDSIGVILRMSLWVLPLLMFVTWKHYKKVDGNVQSTTRELFLKCAYASIILTVCVQLFRGIQNFFYKTGYMGSHQSRYYLCVAMILAFCIVSVLEREDEKIGKKLNGVILLSGAYFMFSDFIYFLLSYTTFIAK